MAKKISQKNLEKINTLFYKSQLSKFKTIIEDLDTENDILKEELEAKNKILIQICSMYITDLDLILPILKNDLQINTKPWQDVKKWLGDINSIVSSSSEIIKKLEKIQVSQIKQIKN